MTVFSLKLLAVLSMICDHLGYWLYAQALIDGGIYTALRTFGRLAFPIFAFLIVNGWMHSRDRKAYLSRLMGFVLISQLFFVTVFTHVNYRAEPGALSFMLPDAVSMLLCLALGFLWYRFVQADASAVLAAALPFVGLCTLRLGELYLLRPHMNVFYTLAISLAAMCVLDKFIKDRSPGRTSCFRALALLIAMLLIRSGADYGLNGLLLMLALWFFRENRMQQLVMLLAWAAVHYLIGGSTVYFLGAAAALIPLYLYNGSAGKPLKTVFYLVYPLHLSLMALVIIWQAYT